MYFEKRKSVFLELGFNETALHGLRKYIDLLWSTNSESNLVSRKMTFEELIDNHVIDCMLPLQYFPQDVKAVADLGSGGGLPALIYALQFPKIKFVLYEKSKLKQTFLQQCQKIAPNIQICAEVPSELKQIDLISARGFKPLDEIIHMTQKYYDHQGRYFLMKARKEKIDEEVLLTQKKKKDFSCRIQALKSPVLDVERHVVLF